MSDERVADVVVVGSGAAGLSAALSASNQGADVVVVESAASPGGTTARSGGICWIPNNTLIRERGLDDPRPDAIRYMARAAYPHLYDPDHPTLGLDANSLRLIEAYYDNASVAVDTLTSIGAFNPSLELPADGRPKGFSTSTWPDYYATLPEDKRPVGRSLITLPRSASESYSGMELVEQLLAVVEARGIPILTSHHVTEVIQDDAGEVVGVFTPEKRTGAPLIWARKGVIFASGGFTRNLELRAAHLGAILGTSAAPTNQGDLVRIATDLGAALKNLDSVWGVEIPLEVKLASPLGAEAIFWIPGDSVIVVDQFGKRVMNEKMSYHERASVHRVWDAALGEYPNRVLFLVWDQRAAERYFPIPGAGVEIGPGSRWLQGVNASHVLFGRTLEDLAAQIEGRLQRLEQETDHLHLSRGFAETLRTSMRRLNEHARAGSDPDFHRGEAPIELSMNGPAQPDNPGNPTMFPMAETGPYYALLLAAGTLDSNGGPVINEKAQILRQDGTPIPGLYGAGNCIAAPAGRGYWGAGGTLGPALTFGYLAGLNASREESRAVGFI